MPAHAEVHVAGNPAAVRITTSQDAIADVLSALGTTFNIRYRAAVPLDAAADPTYSGSFRQVVSRLLDRYNYVMKVGGDFDRDYCLRPAGRHARYAAGGRSSHRSAIASVSTLGR